MENPARSYSNLLLATLAPSDLALLKPGLERVDLPLRKMLEARNRRIESVYFLESGLASMVLTAGSNHSVEVGIIGHEGMTGVPVLMGLDRSPHETFIQTAGEAWRIDAVRLTAMLAGSDTLRLSLLRFAHLLQVQMSFTALANARYKLEERLARWLLMAADRADGPQIFLTHEFLSLMLGVRRPGVTTAVNAFERRGVIRAARGSITILDRRVLEDDANGSYGIPEAEAERLFGKSFAAVP